MLDIKYYGEDVLKKKTDDIKKITSEIKSLAEEMIKTMHEKEGVGLAAPQVGHSLNMFVLDLSAGEDPDKVTVLINPEIIETSGEQMEEEGCLSFPFLIAKIKRPAFVKAKYTDLNGDEQTIEGEGLMARALSHEIDHLNGVVFIDHIKGLEKNLLMKKLKKLMDSDLWQKAS